MTVPIDLSPAVLEGIRVADEIASHADVLVQAYDRKAAVEALSRAARSEAKGDRNRSRFWLDVYERVLAGKP